MRYKIHNKKSVAFDDAMHMAVVILIGVILFFAFTLTEKSAEIKKTVSIQKQKEIASSQRLLMDYLSSIDFSGDLKALALARQYQNKDYDLMLSSLKVYFDSKLDKVYWRIDIEDYRGEKISSIDGGFARPAEIYEAASALIPLNNYEKNYFRIKLHLGRGLAYDTSFAKTGKK